MYCGERQGSFVRTGGGGESGVLGHALLERLAKKLPSDQSIYSNVPGVIHFTMHRSTYSAAATNGGDQRRVASGTEENQTSSSEPKKPSSWMSSVDLGVLLAAGFFADCLCFGSSSSICSSGSKLSSPLFICSRIVLRTSFRAVSVFSLASSGICPSGSAPRTSGGNSEMYFFVLG